MRKQWAVIAAVTFLTAGCGSGVDGVEVTGVPQERWDPCSIPADAIAGTGLDPASQKTWSDGVVVDDWTMCAWRGPISTPWYFFSVRFSNDYTLDDARADSTYSDVIDVAVQERQAVRYQTNIRGQPENCNLAMASVDGTIKTSVDVIGSERAKLDPCTVLLAHATDLLASFPPHTR
ncbi:DUF3558 domain-containing protein [Rhodococcus sp. BP-252]|uniref:DUF3558 domain-containing protein n=2 Tax=Mycobacteriales TaxID=85007 RepID=A0A177YIE5_9NOCA|nr:DUF3558 domain-containing protein [Rhodococcus sp. BP-320]MBY6419326.1 DUF3558 domain-containing protein [Rhodococcus sp. BP-321]MBY6424308.1 DUF3558 domain-containing protein [Rhodococcus sp. BP-324]MBY6429405.1 DUF3558 domain-containing protein [Rhodococcus sp. BP-323]MBY6431924.1 DUF3558 domain-containing protein [Rhodococcus sp. BP-322]MBY6443298.1 DUF3558 domain-containing protein [Rhodococcus sp. BP-319]MBY6448060.1 DUF3558 domain-containing protein [Rhodococcus sp. BP-318]MBY645301